MGGILDLPEPYLFLGGMAIIAGLIILPVLVFSRALRLDRGTALRRFAARHGFQLMPEEHPWHEDWYETFDLLARERPREQRNIMMGQWRGWPAAVLDYDYVPAALDEEPQPATASRTVAIVYLPWSLPGVIIEPNATNFAVNVHRAPEGRGGGAHPDYALELGTFGRRYVLLGEDLGAAQRLVHPAMEAYLLEHQNLGVEVAGAAAVFFAYCVLRPVEIKGLLDFAAGFCELIPDELKVEEESSVGSNT
ncbi:MAG: hypothetical protein JW889_08555 [Verrucomicrobia bacterium]|nr:hypothetical protein [Verrucomicrobiota bacterium]